MHNPCDVTHITSHKLFRIVCCALTYVVPVSSGKVCRIITCVGNTFTQCTTCESLFYESTFTWFYLGAGTYRNILPTRLVIACYMYSVVHTKKQTVKPGIYIYT